MTPTKTERSRFCMIPVCVICGKEDGAILKVDVFELNLDKLAYPTSKLKDELQYQFIS